MNDHSTTGTMRCSDGEDRDHHGVVPGDGGGRDIDGPPANGAPRRRRANRAGARLTREEEVAAFLAGDVDALVLDNMRAIDRIARSYAKGRRPLHQDLVQCGMMGFTYALKKWDPSRGNRLMTYANFRVNREIREHARQVRRMVTLPYSDVCARAIAAVIAGRASSPEELATVANATLLVAGPAFAVLTSVDMGLERHSPDGEPYEWLPSGSDPEAEVIAAVDVAKLRAAIETAITDLTLQEARVIRLRWLGAEVETMDVVAAEMGITRSRVGALDISARRKMGHALRAFQRAA